MAHSQWRTGNVHVIQKSHQNLVREIFLGGLHRCIDPQRKQERHERVSLLASFALTDLVNNTKIIVPQIRGLSSVEQSDKKDLLASWQPLQSFQHCPLGDHVEGADSVYRKHCRMRIRISQSLRHMGDTLRACSRPFNPYLASLTPDSRPWREAQGLNSLPHTDASHRLLRSWNLSTTTDFPSIGSSRLRDASNAYPRTPKHSASRNPIADPTFQILSICKVYGM